KRNVHTGNADSSRNDRVPTRLGRRPTVELGLVGGVRETLEALQPKLRPHTDRSFLDKAQKHYAKAREELDELATPTPDGTTIHPQYRTRLVDEKADADATLTVHVGTPTLWAARMLPMNRWRSRSRSLIHGSIIKPLPQARDSHCEQSGRSA
ncbi:ubiquinone-dependent pyruvate dehydrogenase, partial [Pseudomonas syringae]